MLLSLKSMAFSGVQASDGDVGVAEDFYFDDLKWAVRYLVVRAGGWWKGKSVLISPIAVRRYDPAAHVFETTLTREQIKGSPSSDTEKPVSRLREREYYDYFRWPYYWAGTALWGAAAFPSSMLSTPLPHAEAAQKPSRYDEESHLRAVQEVTDYAVMALNGRVGEVVDLIVSDEDWRIQYLVVETMKHWRHRAVLISPDWVESFRWSRRQLVIGHTCEQVKASPSYDPHAPINRDYEARLYDFYGRPTYWREELYRKVF
jgi:hypothetical protein